MRHQPVHQFKGYPNEENNLCIQCGTNLCIGSRAAQMKRTTCASNAAPTCASFQGLPK
ncbi:hypothetical protein RHGRI_029973 [Rhododendron griersonianum]|uniref:Uncharacterized protein n=1 Tax=Rhododendron griersonianum TaxID=479676 RepID=A0AAV6IPP8_9ERIC|nr:hypothetical protein RHGRI_029973 [Rhododendron griersonianum]